MTKNRTRTPVYLDPGMHPGLEVKGLTIDLVTGAELLVSFNRQNVVCEMS